MVCVQTDLNENVMKNINLNHCQHLESGTTESVAKVTDYVMFVIFSRPFLFVFYCLIFFVFCSSLKSITLFEELIDRIKDRTQII